MGQALVVLGGLTDRVLGLVLGGVTDRVLGLVLGGVTDRVKDPGPPGKLG